MIALAGGTFTMGSSRHYPEERPARPVQVGAFEIDEHPVTVEMFASFVAASGHVTEAERAGGSLVFVRTSGPVNLQDPSNWWTWREGVSWRDRPGDHPVVHVAASDAAAYAAWAGKALPTEAQWEFAAQGASVGNVWGPGEFPWQHDGEPGTTSVGAFGDGPLSDLLGNVWELTADVWSSGRGADVPCCGSKVGGLDGPGHGNPPRLSVAKGGSFLCAPNYCARYRPAARIASAEPTAHTGFRCIRGAG